MIKLNIERGEKLRGGLFAISSAEIAVISLALDLLARDLHYSKRITQAASELSADFLEVFDNEK